MSDNLPCGSPNLLATIHFLESFAPIFFSRGQKLQNKLRGYVARSYLPTVLFRLTPSKSIYRRCPDRTKAIVGIVFNLFV